MALILKDNISWAANGKYFNIYDTTGTQSSQNTGGYGAPNPLPSNASTAVLQIWNPASTTLLPTPSATPDSTVNLYPTLPNYAGAPFQVTNTLAGFGDTFDDGAYYMTYTITGTLGGDPFTYSVSCYQFAVHNIRCCLDKWNAKINSCGCGSNHEEFDKYIQAELKFQDMMRQICCTHVEKATELLKSLKKMCPNGCGC